MNLFELTQEQKILQFLLDEHCATNEGDVTDISETMEQWQSQADMSLESKLEAIGRLLREFTAQAEAQKEEANKLNAKAKTNENKASRLKEWALYCLQSADIQKINTKTFNFTVAKSPSATFEVTAELSDIPEKWINVKRTANLSAIKEAYIQCDPDAINLGKLNTPKQILKVK
jgi:hypothetical protein